MLDISLCYDRYKFLGYEFLTWLWFVIENDQEQLRKLEKNLTSFDVGNRIVLENQQSNDMVESITIKGDDADFEEGIIALKKGSMVTEMNLIHKSGGQEWHFTLKGESFNIGNLKPPETGKIESKEDIEGAILEKIYLYEKAVLLIDTLFKYFIQIRLSKEWNNEAVPRLRSWIYSNK